jgi:cytidylate kinase
LKQRLVITVDGPAGSGKSTVSRLLAERLSCAYLDTGALYRAVALKALREGIDTGDVAGLEALCGRTRVTLRGGPGGQTRVFVDDEDVTLLIRTPEVSMLASKVSAVAAVRQALLPIQRKAAADSGVVAEGRDMGTVVFPDAPFKFFLTASIEERSRRRYLELVEKDQGISVDNVREDVTRRDRQDSDRQVAPLRAAEGAIVIDSTNLGIAEVIEKMLKIIRAGR